MANRARTTEAGVGRDMGAERSPAPDEAPRPTDNAPGQLAVDDRGNVSWQWADDPELLADDILGNTARLRALAPADLKLADEELAAKTDRVAPVAAARKTPQAGYNPYNSGERTKQSWKKKRDLRQLSKWIELKKRLRGKPDQD